MSEDVSCQLCKAPYAPEKARAQYETLTAAAKDMQSAWELLHYQPTRETLPEPIETKTARQLLERRLVALRSVGIEETR